MDLSCDACEFRRRENCLLFWGSTPAGQHKRSGNTCSQHRSLLLPQFRQPFCLNLRQCLRRVPGGHRLLVKRLHDLRACLKTRPVRAPGLQATGFSAQSCRPCALTRRFSRAFKHALNRPLVADRPQGPACTNPWRSPKTPSPFRDSPTPVSQADNTTNHAAFRSSSPTSCAIKMPSSSGSGASPCIHAANVVCAPANANPLRCMGLEKTTN